MKTALMIACSAVAFGAVAATAGAAPTAVESRAACAAFRADVGTAAFTTAFKSAASCRGEVAPFALRTVAALRRACNRDAACTSALAGTAAAAARRIVLPMQACTSRYGSSSLTSAFVACLASTFRNELRTAMHAAVKCTAQASPSQVAACLARVQPAPAPVQPTPPAQTTVPAYPAPAPADRCSGGGTGFGPGVECPMASPGA
ncbi:MAG TPA: hypothetical protein VGL76_09040 [Gaiellaceae bacterium]